MTTRSDRNKERKRTRKIGLLLVLIQAIVSVALIGTLLAAGIIPTLYLAILSAVLVLLFLGTLASQLKRKGRAIGGKIVSVLLIFTLSIGVFYSWKLNDVFKQIAGGSENTESADIVQKPFSVYISGIDVYGELEQTSRSDVNIIATVNPSTNQVLLTTTPRDYYVTIPGVSGDEKDKLTHAGIYGVETSMKTLENLYDTEIDYYVRVNFTSLMEIVDLLGGIDVYSELAFTTSSNSGVVMEVKEGINHFNGKEALAFSRERKNLAAGDNQRGKNQTAVLSALIDKLTSPKMLLKASSILDSISSNVDTNLSENQIQSLIKMQLSKGNKWDIETAAAEGTGGTDYTFSTGTRLYVTYPDESSVNQIKQMMDDVENGKTSSEQE